MISEGSPKDCKECNNNGQKLPQRCAVEGVSCLKCKGNIFYGTGWSFKQLVENKYSFKKGNPTGEVPCNSDSFGDPQPGYTKLCFCDDVGAIDKKQLDQDVKSFKANEAYMKKLEAE